MRTETQAPPIALSNREDFAELSRQVREVGLLARRRGYYTIKIAATIGGLGATVAAVILVGDSWWNLVVAVGLAFVMVQLGFIGHDAGHRQICTRRRDNDLIGLVHANLLTGFSFGWWLTKHNRHHAHTNRPGKDPDLAPGALVYTPDQVRARGRFGQSFAPDPGRPLAAPPVSRSPQPARGERPVAGPATGPGGADSKPVCWPSTPASSSWRRS